MMETIKTADAQNTRGHALIFPREHGAWGLLLVPLFTGAAAGLAVSPRLWPVLVLTIAALSLFWLRTPVESLLGSGVLVARTSSERKAAFLASVALGIVSIGCLAALMWNGHNSGLLLIGSVAALAFVAQILLRRLGRPMRMTSQLIGAIGLTATAAAAYYSATLHLDARAFILWAANWLFACDQIHFVQLRIHAARVGSVSEKFARGKWFFVGQVLLLMILLLAWLWRLIHPFVVLAFIPALVRGVWWFLHKPEPLDVKKLGWSEMGQGIAFGVLLATAFVI